MHFTGLLQAPQRAKDRHGITVFKDLICFSHKYLIIVKPDKWHLKTKNNFDMKASICLGNQALTQVIEKAVCNTAPSFSTTCSPQTPNGEPVRLCAELQESYVSINTRVTYQQSPGSPTTLPHADPMRAASTVRAPWPSAIAG